MKRRQEIDAARDSIRVAFRVPANEVLARLPEQPPDPERMMAAFENFGLPERFRHP